LQNFSTNTQSPTLWIVTEGLAGTENQCLGVAEALGVEAEVKRISLTQPWKLLSPYLGFECHASFAPRLFPPWPDILVTSGRKAIAVSRYIKRQSQGKTFTVHIQDPRVNPQQFDIVAVPQHDPSRGDNVIVTVATPNRIRAKKLEVAKQEFLNLFENIPSPRIAVLIGGSTKSHVMTVDETEKIITQLKPLSNLMITPSRRTGEENIRLLKENLSGHYFWDGLSANPYMGMLAWADIILVTSDSTSMISEAASTGKPVYTLPMKGLSKRQNQLVENLKKYGAVREFDGKLEVWTYEALADSQKIAAVIRQKCGLFR
jgi:mitochondrial fission protein ELM1